MTVTSDDGESAPPEETGSTAIPGIFGGDLESLTKDPKAAEDHSELVIKARAAAETLVKAGRIQDAVEELLAVEKKARQASDGISVSKLAQHILTICKDAGDWQSLATYITLLTKKRSQLKRAIVDMVQLAMKFLDEITDKETKLSLIETLSKVTCGKIFVEVERARLIMVLVKMKEADGDIEGAAAELEDVQVETFGAMDRREKAEYILEQMRFVLAKGDYVRCHIISKKISIKLLEVEAFQDIKIRFYEFMIRYNLHEQDYLSTAKAIYSIYSAPIIQADIEKRSLNLESYIIMLILSPFSNEQSDLLNKVRAIEGKKLEDLPIFRRLVDDVLSLEIIPWPLQSGVELQKHSVFANKEYNKDDVLWNLLRTRIIQLNVRILGTHYSRMRLERISLLLKIERSEAEKRIAELVTSGYLTAKIDRPAGIVRFAKRKDTSETLNEWSTDFRNIVTLVEESCHLVEKARMVHAAAKQKKVQAAKTQATETAR